MVSSSYLRELTGRAMAPVAPVKKHGPGMYTKKAAGPAVTKRASMANTSARRARQQEADERKRLAELNKTDPPEEEVAREMSHERATNPALSEAKDRFCEEEDEIKALKFQITLARNHAVNQALIEEKRRKAEKEREFEALAHKRADKDRRRRNAEFNASIEAQRKRDREAAEELMKQKAEVEFNKMMDEERTILEGEQLVAAIKKAEEEDRRKAAAKVEEGKRRMADLRVANAQALQMKERAKRAEAAAEKRAMRFLIEKAHAEQALLDERAAEKAAKDALFQKQLAEQEKVMDQRGEEDAARAKRYQEAAILKEREVEAAKVAARETLMKQVAEEREIQLRLKAEARERELQIERRLVRQQRVADRAKAAAAITDEEEKVAERLANASVVREQMRVRAEAAAHEKKYKYKPREELLRQEALRKVKIDFLTTKKMEEMKTDGVDTTVMRRAHLPV